MKKGVLFFGAMTLIAFLLFTVSCESDPYEYCEQETFCNDQEVEACCTDDNGDVSCVYKFNGKEYTSLDDLEDALGCSSTSSIVLKSADADPSQDEIRMRLENLMERAHAGLQALKDFN